MTMEDVHPNWKGLPVEILYEIFQFADEHFFTDTTSEFALVCKAWSIPAQAVLYSDVRINELEQLRKFCSTVEHNSQLGRMVKKFNYCIYELEVNADKDEKLNLMTDLLTNCLPKLENLYIDPLGSYIPLLNALQDSQLKHLRKVDAPQYDMEKSELAAYSTCALFLKDRIEEIEITEVKDEQVTDPDKAVTSSTQLYFNRLYSRLDQFDKLRSLEIDKKTNDEIQEIEYILKSCKSLKSLTFNFDRPDEEHDPTLQNKITPIGAISTFTPTLDIKKVVCRAIVSDDYRILLYVMHKFSQLQNISIRVQRGNSTRLNQIILTQLLNYLSKIDTYYVQGICVDNDKIPDILGDYWSENSRPGTESVHVNYSSHVLQQNGCFLNVIKNDKSKEPDYNFEYPSTNHNSEHIRFLQKNGGYIKKYKFEFSSYQDSEGYLLPSDFISQTFKSCPNIQILHIVKCCFKQYSHSKMDLRNKPSLQELYFYQCQFYPGVLERLSLLISEVKKLCIGGLFRDNGVIQPSGLEIPPDDPDLEINMPHTIIDRVTIVIVYDRILHLKVFTVNQKEYYYYKYQNKDLKPSNEEEYTKLNSQPHIYLCFKSNPIIEIK